MDRDMGCSPGAGLDAVVTPEMTAGDNVPGRETQGVDTVEPLPVFGQGMAIGRRLADQAAKTLGFMLAAIAEGMYYVA